MKWYWYAARDNELFIDCDSKILLDLFFRRMERVNPSLPYPLGVKEVFVTTSGTEDHFHIAILLKKKFTAVDRAIWQLYLADDVYRSTMNLFRARQLEKANGRPAPILLISPVNWITIQNRAGQKFWRNADAICNCAQHIHKSYIDIWKCPAHIRLRGKQSPPS